MAVYLVVTMLLPPSQFTGAEATWRVQFRLRG